MTRFVVVPASGHYGDHAFVHSAHATAAAALAAARRFDRWQAYKVVVREAASLRAGDRWLRVYEETSPLVRAVAS